MRHIDYLIVGQGLAGTLLAYSLLCQKKRILVIDHPKATSASRIASGIMNPITGRRFVKSWMFEELVPTAKEIYNQLEQKLGTKLLYPRNIIRTVHDSGGLNDWMARSSLKEYAPYVVEETNQVPFDGSAFKPMGKCIESTGSYQVDIPKLVDQFASFLTQNDSYEAKVFDHNMLHQIGSAVRYGDIHAQAIIFCEGPALAENPLFSSKLLHPSIGERLIVRCPDLKLSRLIKRKYFLAPLAGEYFWYGADTHWNFDDAMPSEGSRDRLLLALRDTIKLPYKLINHDAAVRPTVKDRRPILGKHPKMDGVYVFNGLGTKGASLAPYWSKVLVKHLIENKPIPEEVAIRRFF